MNMLYNKNYVYCIKYTFQVLNQREWPKIANYKKKRKKKVLIRKHFINEEPD